MFTTHGACNEYYSNVYHVNHITSVNLTVYKPLINNPSSRWRHLHNPSFRWCHLHTDARDN